MTDNTNGLYQLSMPSPPKSEVDENSLQKSMDKNKESLKVKLMLRRPISQLIDQGIMPPLRTSPAFHEQRQKLERAKTGDILKGKIQRRPARQHLIQQHILEDTTIDPSLQERQRLLKKARLQDDLNDRLSHRPGPLELIKGNILKTDEPLAQAIKDGQLTFRNTSEGELRKHPGPMFFYEEDSGSDGTLSPAQESPIDIQGISTNSIVSLSDSQHIQLASPAPSLTTTASSISDIRSPFSSLSSPSGSIGSPSSTFSITSTSFGNVPTSTAFLTSTTAPSTQIRPPTPAPIKQEPGGGKAKKKSKSKLQPKARTIKFHEYKGPPSAQKNTAIINSSNDSETTYDLLLQQQQLFLQWQLEWQHKYPQILLPATQKSTSNGEAMPQSIISGVPSISSISSSNNVMLTSSAPQSRQSSPPAMGNIEIAPGSPLIRTISKLEDLKVSDLKAELKKRNLPVSGPKPQLIERLKPFTDQVVQMTNCGFGSAASSVSSLADTNTSHNSPPLSVSSNSSVSHNPAGSLSPDDFSMIASVSPPPQSPPDQPNRPASVAPMETEIQSNGNHIAMDTHDGGKLSPVSEEHVKQQHKRVQELQNELQRSQMQLQKTQNILNQQQSKQPAPGLVGNSTTKMLQQHIQQKIQQQQNLQRQKILQQLQQQQKMLLLQQQQQQQQPKKQLIQQVSGEDLAKQLQQQQQSVQIPIVTTSAGNITISGAPMSLPTTLAGQLLIGQNVLTAASIPFVTLTNNNQVNIVNGNDVPALKTARANSLPNSIGHTRVGTINNFNQNVNQMQRTITDPQFILAKPPPAYDEATKQIVDKNEGVKMNGNAEKKKVSKSQAVEDVLEILIRNGELPPSVAQDPTTAVHSNATKSSSEPPAFPTSPVTAPSSCNIKIEPNDETLENCLDNLMSSEPHEQRDTNNFNLELLELEGLESMDLTGLQGDATHSSMSQGSMPQFGQTSSVSMDVDMDWLDSIISPPSLDIANSTPNMSMAPQIQHANVFHCHNNENDHDPMLSVTSSLPDPLDLFALNDTDIKGHNELGSSLSWDCIDFAS